MNAKSVAIRCLESDTISELVRAFDSANWPKPAAIFEQYLQEQKDNQRLIWVAFKENRVAGYITLKWHSAYQPFQVAQIPEIMDFNVLPTFREQGIGAALLAVAETHAFAKHEIIGLGVGLYADYGAALKLYIKQGYKPDGRGITYHYQTMNAGASVCLDDDLVLWLTKTRAALRSHTVVSTKNASHYIWGNNCDGWWLHQTNKLTVIYERMPPHTFEQKHYHHNTEQFFYCLEGQLCIEVNKDLYVLNAHEGLSIPEGIAHQAINKSTVNALFLVISCPNSHHDRINITDTTY